MEILTHWETSSNHAKHTLKKDFSCPDCLVELCYDDDWFTRYCMLRNPNVKVNLRCAIKSIGFILGHTV